MSWLNPAAAALTGLQIGADVTTAAEGFEREQLVAFLRGAVDVRVARIELDGLAGKPVEVLGQGDGSGSVTVAVYDLSEFRRQLEQVRVLARTDPLTGLPNRLAFFDEVQRLRTRTRGEEGPAVGVADLDAFKTINDLYGHSEGDRILAHVGESFRAAVTEGEIVARLGGDEFAFCVPAGGVARAVELADDVSAALSRGVELSTGETITVGMSAGVAAYDSMNSVDNALQAADVALYRAKQSRRGQAVVYEPEPHERDEEVRRLGRTIEQLRRRADVDARTGLLRDHVFEDDLRMLWDDASSTGAEVSLLLVDLDRFHDYNERYLYEAGHRALRSVAGAVTEALRAGDGCYRYGGEELAVILPDADAAAATATAERIRSAVEALGIDHDGLPGGVLTVSVGACTAAPGSGTRPAWLVNGANVAVDRAKAAGRNAVEHSEPSRDAPPISARR